MKKDTLKNNIKWLLERYKFELELEEQKDISLQNLDIINDYKNIIIELEFALDISIEEIPQFKGTLNQLDNLCNIKSKGE